ncbi:MAG: hypothetical protein IPM07_17725 [Anaerolineales bacterium]|nr:hypothetical protein [Anaerolineales bacterium]
MQAQGHADIRHYADCEGGDAAEARNQRSRRSGGADAAGLLRLLPDQVLDQGIIVQTALCADLSDALRRGIGVSVVHCAQRAIDNRFQHVGVLVGQWMFGHGLPRYASTTASSDAQSV